MPPPIKGRRDLPGQRQLRRDGGHPLVEEVGHAADQTRDERGVVRHVTALED